MTKPAEVVKTAVKSAVVKTAVEKTIKATTHPAVNRALCT
jgi:hypothetical protein